jgi:hypothetical protein
MVFNTAAVAAAHLINNDIDSIDQEILEVAAVADYHYYDLVIKKFYSFPVIKVAVNEFPELKIKTVNSQTLSVSLHWIFQDEECQGKPINYVNENLEKYLKFSVWDHLEEDVLNKYLDELRADYEVVLDKSSLRYETRTAWVVDRITDDKRIEILNSNKFNLS